MIYFRAYTARRWRALDWRATWSIVGTRLTVFVSTVALENLPGAGVIVAGRVEWRDDNDDEYETVRVEHAPDLVTVYAVRRARKTAQV